MRRSTIIGCFVGLLSLTMSAQSTQPTTSKSNTGTTNIEVQKKPTASIQELLARYQNMGSLSDLHSEYFSKEEQQILLSYFSNQRPAKSNQDVKDVSGKNTTVAASPIPIKPRSFIKSEAVNKTQYTPLFIASAYADKFGNSTEIDVSTENRAAYRQAPLFLAPVTLTAEDEAEILAAAQRRTNTNIENNIVTRNRGIQSDIIPTAGATETFTPAVGDHFFDPGGPGGGPTGGTPGNYPNCGCDTQTTLAGVSEIDFQFFSVFATFDYLRIYDGTDATGTLLYDNGSGGPNSGDITLADMIASHGSSTFTAASGNFFFFFHATAVVDYGGWDVEIVTAAGGGGGGDPIVYGLNLRASCSNDFGSFPLPGPYTIAPITTNTNPIYGGDFDGSGTLYAFNATAVTLLTLNTTTGAETTVASITGLNAGEGLRGMAWNESNSTMYLMAGLGDVGSIYTVDLTSGAATLVGSTTVAGWLPIWLAIDSNGNAFMAELASDVLYSVNLATGAATLVGPLGININFAQDADFDPDTDTLYMAAYVGGGVNQFCSVNTTTGAVTQLGSVNSDCAEMGIVAIMGTGGGGGGGSACSQADISNAFENGYGNTNNTVEVADEIIVAAGVDFEVDQLTINMINNGGFNSIDVGFYQDAGGMPGALIGSIMTIVPTSSTPIGVAFGRDVLEIVLDFGTPIMLAGSQSMETVYWIGVETPNPVDPVSDAYWETTSVVNAGTDYRVHYDVANGGWTETDPVDNLWNTVYNVSGTCEPIGGGGSGCTAGVYTDRASFDAETGPINLEDFAGGPGTIQQCGLVISNTGESCFAAGEILPGVEITTNNSAGDQTVYVDPADGFGNTVPVVGSNAFVDYTIINFPNNDVNSFGFDLITLFSGSPVEVRVFGAGGLIDTQTATATIPESFWGYIGSETIVRVELEDLTGANVELIGMLAFGECSGGGGGNYDDCSGAIALACGDSVTGETLTATDSGGNAAPDVFYKFTGSGTPQLVTISLCGGGTDYDSLLRVFDDCDLLNQLAVNDDSCGLQSEVTFVSDGTSTYYIMVEGFGSASGNFSLDVTCADPLPNDDCSGAIAVSCGDSVSGSTVGATIDTAPTCGTPITSPGVWYKLNDNSGLPGDITLSLCNGTDFDSKISVYSGTCAALVCVDGNDDACGLQSEVTFASNGNTQYYILIHSFGGATGNFTLEVTCTPTPPPNDMIVNSIDVDQIGFPYTDPAVAMPAATTENGNPVNCDLTGAKGVWYNFVPTGDGTANAMIVTPGGASSVTFYTAPNENAVETDLTLVPQQTNQCAPGTSASIFTLAGQAYYVFVMNTGAVTDIVIDGTNLGVSDNTIAGFSYYPNPTNGILNLKSVDNIEHVSMYNLLGQLVIDNRVNATTSQVDISGLSTGTYLMKVTVNGETGTYKVLKQ